MFRNLLTKFVPAASTRRPAARTPSFRPMLESLEDRRLPSSSSLTISPATTTLVDWIGTDGNIYRFSTDGTTSYPSGLPLTTGLAPGVVTQISAGNNALYGAGGNVFALAGGDIWENPYSRLNDWTQLTFTGSYTQIAAGINNTVFGLTTAGGVDKIQADYGTSNGPSLGTVSGTVLYDGSAGPITDISATNDSDGALYAVFGGNVYAYVFGTWNQFSRAGDAAKVSAWAENTVYVQTTAGGVDRISGGQLFVLYDGSLGPVANVTAGTDQYGDPAVYVLGGGSLFTNDGSDASRWASLSPPTAAGAMDLAADFGSHVFALTPDSTLFEYYNAQGWMQDGNTGAVA